MGIQGVVWLVVTFVWFFRRKRVTGQHVDAEDLISDLSLGVLLFTVGLALFAFPFENAYSFYVTAIFLGLHLNRVIPKSKPFVHWKVGFALATIVVSVLGFGYAATRYVEVVRADDLKTNEVACRWFPSNWWTCVQAGHLALERGEAEKAEKMARRLLLEGPDNAYGSNLLILALKAQGKIAESCKLAERHARVFGARKAASDEGDVCLAIKPHGT